MGHKQVVNVASKLFLGSGEADHWCCMENIIDTCKY